MCVCVQDRPWESQTAGPVPSIHLPGTWCSSPLPPAGFAPATAACPLFGNTEGSPIIELDLFKVAIYF